MNTAAKKRNSLASSVMASVVVLVSALFFASAASASSASASLLGDPASIDQNSPTTASTHHVVAPKTRVEIFLGVSLKSIERSELNPINATRYYDVLEGVALGCTLAPVSGLIDDAAHFSQKTFKQTFSEGGKFAGKTIDDVAGALRNGSMKPSDVPIEFFTRGSGQQLILNTRSAEALRRAGIPRDQWTGSDIGGNFAALRRLAEQLQRNKLGPNGTPTVRPSGGSN